MKKYFVSFLFCFSFFVSHAQQSPWNTVAPAGSMVYTDLKSAIKESANCYRLDLSSFDFYKDKKLLPKSAELTNVMAFRIGNNNVSIIPSVFLQMHSLIFFQSFGNPLTSLSDSLGMWSELRYLQLSDTKFDTLPNGIYGCTKLFSITIANNKDTLKITNDISSLHGLTELDIYRTNLRALPDSLSKISKLGTLVFFKCGLKKIPEQITSMNKLSELVLDSNSISSIPRTISLMHGLTYLSLKGNKIKHVTSSISFLTSLTTLDLRGNPIDPYEIKILQAELPSCSILF